MATLNTLRTKGGWIVSIVIGLALIAFLIGDLAGGNSVFGLKEKVGKIDGNSVTYMDYAQRVESITDINKMLSGNESMTAEQQEQIRNYAWESLIQEIAIFPGMEAMGIMVTEDEMYERIYGNSISPVLLNWGMFNNPETGAYDRSVVQNFVRNLDADYTGNSRRVWQYIQEQVYQEAMMSKYLALVSNIAYVTDAEAEQSAVRTATSYNARYVMQPYSSIADSLIKVSSSEIRKYYDDRKDLFRQVASRDIEYVIFEVVPSQKDYADARAAIEELAAEFIDAENIQQYVSLNSQDQFNPTYYTREQLPSGLAEYAFSANREGLFGPHLENDVYSISRVSDIRSFPDTIGFRQMAFAPGSELLADSVFNVLKRGGDFDRLADEYSLIPAASADAGRVPTMMIPMEIGESIYSTQDKWVKVEMPNGIMLMDVYYRGPVSQKVQIANVNYYIEPSAATQQAAYAKANGFYTATAGLKANFDKIVADSAYSKRVAHIQAGQGQISGLENGREMIRWAFNAKTGNLSNIMEIDNNYVIAVLTGAAEDGYVPVEQAQVQIRPILVQEKKADMLADQMKGVSSLETLAQTLSVDVNNLEEVTYNSYYMPELGFEPAVIGAVAGGVPEGQVSKPIRGANGVYVAQVTSKNTEEDTSPEMERVRLEARDQYSLPQRALGSLIQLSNVVDGRAKYF